MSESNPGTETVPAETAPARVKKKGWSKLLIGWTLLGLAGLLILRAMLPYLNDQYNLDPAVPNLLLLLFIVTTVLAWAFWALTFGRRRLVGLLLLIAPALFLTFYYPNVRGDANISGWKPRFWKSTTEFAEVNSSEPAADLATTTEHDFPQFLGPYRNANVGSIELASNWEQQQPRLMWKQDIGEGWSGFAAVNGYAVTQEQREDQECVTCYEIESGTLVWIYSAHRRHEDTMAMGKVGPRATPTIHDGRVYATSGTGVLDCLDGSNGKLIWSQNVPALVGIDQKTSTNGRGLDYTEEESRLAWGRSGSPLIYQDMVIVPAGGPLEDTENQTTTMIAFDRLTGDLIWRGGKRMIAYGSPAIETILGEPQIVLVTEGHAVGHDPETGKELWSHERSGRSNQDANCSQVTRVSDSRLILSKGYSMGGELVELTRQGDGIQVNVVQKDPRVLKTKLTSPVIYRGHAYSLSDGFLECTEIDTFRRKWKQRGRFGNGQLLLVGDRLLVHTEWGELKLVAADPTEYRELGSIDTIRGICWNTLCLYEDKLLVRSELEAACFQLPTQGDRLAASDQ